MESYQCIASLIKCQTLKYFLLFLFLSATQSSVAQIFDTNTSTENAVDTINVSGVVMDNNGYPAKNVFISRPFYQCYPKYKIITITDSLGKFHLNGLRFKDTLQLQATNFSQQIINNGSRTLHIILPPITQIVTHSTVKIEAAEVSKKESSDLPNKDNCGEDYFYYAEKTEAEFPGGADNFRKYIGDKLVYPQQSLKDNIEGEVVLQFEISPDGTPNNFTIVSGLNKECNQAALKVLTQMPKWKPAILYRPVISTHSIAIQFAINRQ